MPLVKARKDQDMNYRRRRNQPFAQANIKTNLNMRISEARQHCSSLLNSDHRVLFITYIASLNEGFILPPIFLAIDSSFAT